MLRDAPQQLHRDGRKVAPRVGELGEHGLLPRHHRIELFGGGGGKEEFQRRKERVRKVLISLVRMGDIFPSFRHCYYPCLRLLRSFFGSLTAEAERRSTSPEEKAPLFPHDGGAGSRTFERTSSALVGLRGLNASLTASLPPFWSSCSAQSSIRSRPEGASKLFTDAALSVRFSRRLWVSPSVAV
eukprot:scaffold301_cov243-Pinguiococcus_pyrenoidosus.AAC.137